MTENRIHTCELRSNQSIPISSLSVRWLKPEATKASEHPHSPSSCRNTLHVHDDVALWIAADRTAALGGRGVGLRSDSVDVIPRAMARGIELLIAFVTRQGCNPCEVQITDQGTSF